MVAVSRGRENAQHRRGSRRAGPERRDGYAGRAVAAAGLPKVLPQGREKAQEALPAGEPTPDTSSPPRGLQPMTLNNQATSVDGPVASFRRCRTTCGFFTAVLLSSVRPVPR